MIFLSVISLVVRPYNIMTFPPNMTVLCLFHVTPFQWLSAINCSNYIERAFDKISLLLGFLIISSYHSYSSRVCVLSIFSMNGLDISMITQKAVADHFPSFLYSAVTAGRFIRCWRCGRGKMFLIYSARKQCIWKNLLRDAFSLCSVLSGVC